ncbi:MFS transporter [Rhodococcus sp. IEGM 1305]|uniref:MFS transporter n=1 Tax=Rhodococcus sp. IEGM 1305 TaxID=3047092 RepID=UPI0024B7C477|nr:MFS transporter [Rhodococcus sp. IEGM 1305]
MTMRDPSPTVDAQKLIDDSPLSSVQRKSLAICLAFAVIDGFDALVIGFVIPAISQEWGRSAASLTPATVAGLIGTIVGSMLITPFADRFGRRPIILAGSAIFAVFTLLAAASTSVEMLAALRFLAGLGLGAVPATLIAYGSEMAPRRMRATIVTVVGSGLAAGGFVGGFAAGFLIPTFGWRSVFVAGGLLPILAMLVALKWLPESVQYLVTRGRHSEATAFVNRISGSTISDPETRFIVGAGTDAHRNTSVRTLFADHRGGITIVLWILYAAQFMTTFFLFSWLPSVLTEAGVGRTTALIATSVCTLGGMLGGVALGRTIDRVASRFAVIGVSFAVGAAAVATTAMVTGFSNVLMFTALFIVGACTIGTGICINSITATLYPAHVRSTGVGWAYGFGRLGSVIGPSIGGVLLAMQFQARSIFLLILVPIAICALAVAALSVLSRRSENAALPSIGITTQPASVTNKSA